MTETGRPHAWLHGTTTRRLGSVQASGLKDPCLTDELEVAEHYAEVAAEEDGSEPLVLWVEVAGAYDLRYDRAAMEEPVLVPEGRRDRAWDRAEAEHPEWVRGGYLHVPETAWEVSYEGAASVRAAGTFTNLWAAESSAGH